MADSQDRPEPGGETSASTPDTPSAEKASAAARLFDIRRLIGGLFSLYGIVLLIAGLVDGDAAKKQAAGIDINIWTGLGMLVVGILFLVWMALNPVEPPDSADHDDADDSHPTAGDQHPRRS